MSRITCKFPAWSHPLREGTYVVEQVFQEANGFRVGQASVTKWSGAQEEVQSGGKDLES